MTATLMGNNNLKMCSSCRGLIAAEVGICPLCGTQAQAARSHSAISEAWTVTGMILTVNLLLYAASLLVTMKLGAAKNASFSLSPSGEANYLLGAAFSEYVAQGQYWRMLTYGFLHWDLLHIIMNSLALVQVGRLAEETFGSAKYFCLYVVAAITGGMSVLFIPSNLTGASGAIFGLIGAMAVYGYKRGGSYGDTIKKAMVQWMIYGLIISFLPGISMAGHVGGLIGGAGMAWFLDGAERDAQSQSRVRLWQVLAGLALLVVIAAFALTALSARAILEAERVRELSLKVVKSAIAYTRFRELEKNEPFDEYRREFGATVTTLELATEVDDESSALRQRLLTLLRERQEQLQKISNAAEAAPRIEQYNAFRQALHEFSGWFKRRRQGLGKAGRDLLPELDLAAEVGMMPPSQTDQKKVLPVESDRTDPASTVPKPKTSEKK